MAVVKKKTIHGEIVFRSGLSAADRRRRRAGNFPRFFFFSFGFIFPLSLRIPSVRSFVRTQSIRPITSTTRSHFFSSIQLNTAIMYVNSKTKFPRTILLLIRFRSPRAPLLQFYDITCTAVCGWAGGCVTGVCMII